MDKLTGYGPSDPAGKGLPLFDGRQDRFPDFKFKATALFLEHELDAIVDCPPLSRNGAESMTRYEQSRTLHSKPTGI